MLQHAWLSHGYELSKTGFLDVQVLNTLLGTLQVDSYDPALMFAVPRLAIVSGLLIYSSGPLSIDKPPGDLVLHQN